METKHFDDQKGNVLYILSCTEEVNGGVIQTFRFDVCEKLGFWGKFYYKLLSVFKSPKLIHKKTELVFTRKQAFEMRNFIADELNKYTKPDVYRKMSIIPLDKLRKDCAPGLAKTKHCLYLVIAPDGKSMCGKLFPAMEAGLIEKSKQRGNPKGDNCPGLWKK